MPGDARSPFQKLKLYCRYYGRFCEVADTLLSGVWNPLTRRRQPPQSEQDALYTRKTRMSICCGYLFFQRDTVYFLRCHLKPKWLAIRPLGWPRRVRNPTVREGAHVKVISTVPHGRVSDLLAAGKEQIELAILRVEHAECVGGLFEHLPSQRD